MTSFPRGPRWAGLPAIAAVMVQCRETAEKCHKQSSALGFGGMTGRETMTTRISGIVIAVACFVGGTAASATNLKPFDPAALQDTVEALGKELLLPGAMVLLRTPQGDFVFGYGATELDGAARPRADTHFRIASNTKTMTAAVTVLLVQEGKLRFDDAVSRYVQGVPNGDDITISELLKLRSGLPSYADAPELTESLDHDPTRVWTPREMLAIAFKRPSLFGPGTEYNYCNTNYVLLGLIIEQVEGKPLVRVFQDRLFGPLGMENTLLPASTSNAIPEPYSHGYMYGSSLYAMTDTPYPADLQAAAVAGTLKPNDDTWQNPSYATAPGGVISTANDLATWMRALVGGKVFNADYQRQWLDSPEPQDQTSRPEVWVWDIADHLWAEQSVFSRRRDARLQLVHGLRSSQRCDSGGLDQPHSVT